MSASSNFSMLTPIIAFYLSDFLEGNKEKKPQHRRELILY